MNIIIVGLVVFLVGFVVGRISREGELARMSAELVRRERRLRLARQRAQDAANDRTFFARRG